MNGSLIELIHINQAEIDSQFLPFEIHFHIIIPIDNRDQQFYIDVTNYRKL